MTGASQRASRVVARERQNSNNQSSVYLDFFFFGWFHSVWGHCLLQNHAVFFYHQDAVFERNLFHNGHNNSLPQEMRHKQRINDLNYSVVVSWTKSARWNVVHWTLIFKRNQDLQQWTRLRVVIRMNMVCTAGFINMFWCVLLTQI